MNKKLVSALAVAGLALPQFSHAASLEDRVAELEAQNSLNYFHISGFLETRYDSISAQQDGSASGVNQILSAINGAQTYNDPSLKDTVGYYRLKASLNIDADVSPRVKFYSRLTASKYFNDFYNEGSTGFQTSESLSEGRDYASSAVYLEKAYADITMFKDEKSSAVFSMGRLPTVDGPMANYINGEPRQGTYPSLVYDAILDGFSFSYNYNLGDSGTLAARLIYTPFDMVYIGNTTNAAHQTVPGHIVPPSFGNSGTADGDGRTTNDVTAYMLEWNKSGGSADNMGVIYQGYQTGSFGVDGASVNSITSGSVFFKIVVNSLTAYADNILGTNLDLGVSTLESTIYNTGGLTVTLNSSPLIQEGIYGLGAGASGQKVNGNATTAFLRYHLNSSVLFGGQYLAGQANTFVYQPVADDITGFNSTPGTAWQVYAIYKPLPEFSMRLAYAEQDYKYDDLGFGTTNTSDRKVKTVSANLRVDF